ncbi:MFS transporter [Clostridium sp. DSM 100503]|uniref:MFS transporter n=1 Tax=Clostridium sp. DSM 100503 TaxID=2963282 RepID=UPI00214A60F7|nr:MFS transporter [Clostridium sp. DSM 100503]MCR1952240.1 MFS transporter [Clostridium sp. DSM 100503]
MTQNKKNLNNKRYFIVFICFLIQAIPYCISQNLQAQMQVPVSESGIISEIGFTMLYFSGTIPVLFNPLLAKLYDKFKIKYIYVAGLIIAGLSFASYGLAQNAFMFNASAFVTQVGTLLFTGLSLPIMMSHWFPGNGRGTALGIALAGGSIGNVFLQQIVVKFLGDYGWQKTYMILGALLMIVGIPLALLFIRYPKENEIVREEASTTNSKAKRVTYEGLSDAENMKNKYFWIFCVGALFICFAAVTLATQAIPVLTTKGFSASQVAMAGSAYGVACLIGNVGGGKLFDKLGSFKPMMISCVGVSLGLLVIIFMPEASALGYLVPIFSGLTVFTITSGPAYMPADVFGHRDGTQKFAKVGMFYALGSSISPLLFTVASTNLGVSTASIIFLAVGLVGYALNGYAIIKSKQMFSNTK